jgi:diguanylate cyclase (GGDEF)-like protein
VTVSVGVASFPDSKISSPESFLAVADTALYRAKADGRNLVRL